MSWSEPVSVGDARLSNTPDRHTFGTAASAPAPVWEALAAATTEQTRRFLGTRPSARDGGALLVWAPGPTGCWDRRDETPAALAARLCAGREAVRVKCHAAGEVWRLTARDARDATRYWKTHLRPPRARPWRGLFGLRAHPARHEIAMIDAARAAGLPVPAARWLIAPRLDGSRRAPGVVITDAARGVRVESLLAADPSTQPALSEAEGLRAGFGAAADEGPWSSVALAAAAGRLAAALHGAGLVHRDLYVGHLFARREETGWALELIDFARAGPAAPGASGRDVVRDLSALQAGMQAHPHGTALAAALRAGYREAGGRASARQWAAIERRARRILRRAPKVPARRGEEPGA